MKPIHLIAFITLLVCSCDHQPMWDDRSNGNNLKGTPAKVVVQREVISHIDYNQVFESKIIDKTPVRLLEIGELKVPTGEIVVCDPLTSTRFVPLNKTVKPGVYPVKIYVAQTEKSGDRYAIAKLEFSPKKANKWVLALHDGDDTSGLKDPYDYLGFPVDAGLAGFFDYKAGLAYSAFQDQFEKSHKGDNVYDGYLAAEFKKHAQDLNNPNDAGDWINLKIPNSNLNITMFQSGYGDGTYPAYSGMTKDNEIVSLIIDFIVLPLYKK